LTEVIAAVDQEITVQKSDFSYKEVVTVDDDFVVPANFAEFYDRYPKYIRTWLIRHRCPQELLADFTHDIIEHFLTVSANGQAKGILDRVMSFSGDRIGGKSAGKFFFYINLLLTRKYMICIKKRVQEPVVQRNTMSIQSEITEQYIPGSVSLEELFTKHGCQDIVHTDFLEVQNKKHFVKGFVRFLKKNEPSILPAVSYFMKHETMPEICDENALKMEELNRLRSRLRILASVYSKGLTKVPNRRKPYTKRQKSIAA
jgi:hypothetical protein